MTKDVSKDETTVLKDINKTDREVKGSVTKQDTGVKRLPRFFSIIIKSK